jgi:hypothetical protein
LQRAGRWWQSDIARRPVGSRTTLRERGPGATRDACLVCLVCESAHWGLVSKRHM